MKIIQNYLIESNLKQYKQRIKELLLIKTIIIVIII